MKILKYYFLVFNLMEESIKNPEKVYLSATYTINMFRITKYSTTSTIATNLPSTTIIIIPLTELKTEGSQ